MRLEKNELLVVEKEEIDKRAGHRSVSFLLLA